MTLANPPPTWRECYEQGVSATEAAALRGVSASAAYNWARKTARQWPDQRAAAWNVSTRTRAASLKRAQDLAQRHQQGESLAALAGAEGVTKQAIFHRLRGRKRGSIYEVLTLLPAATHDWLTAQVPVGSTIAELVAAVIKDAYAEAQEKEQDK